MEAPTAEPPLTLFDSNKLRGLKYEPNTVVPVMEDKLGIKFKSPPKKARVRSSQDLAPFLHEGDTSIGVYHFDTNTFYHWGNSLSDHLHLDNYFVELHETAHAYIDQESPDMKNTNFESVLLNLALHEGMADWMAIETLARLDSGAPDDMNPHHFGAINSNLPGVKRDKINEDHINSALETFYGTLSKFRREQLQMTLDNFRKLRKEVDSEAHILGHYYVHHHMNRLISNGLSIADALRIVIKNPPVRIEQLIGSRLFPLDKRK